MASVTGGITWIEDHHGNVCVCVFFLGCGSQHYLKERLFVETLLFHSRSTILLVILLLIKDLFLFLWQASEIELLLLIPFSDKLKQL